MALKDLLVVVDQNDASVARLSLAADLAARHQSRLAALFFWEYTEGQIEMRRSAELGLASGSDYTRLHQRLNVMVDDAADRLLAQLRQLGQTHAIEFEWRVLDGSFPQTTTEYIRYADLSILGPHQSVLESLFSSEFPERLLFATGRPLIFVPLTESFATLGRHIVIGWNESLPATRAVSAALPLIERAERTTVITIDSAGRGGGDPAAERLVTHLKRHHPSVDSLRIRDRGKGSVAETLQDAAHRLGADLMITGAYGHSKLWETLAGGVTHNLLRHLKVPVFMSH